MAEELEDWCFAWFPGVSTSGKDKASLRRANKWNKGNKITVGFLNGDPSLHARIEKVASSWTGPQMANLILRFVNTNDAMIRISFDRPGNWSAIGTTCLNRKDVTVPTMNLGGLQADSPQQKLERSVLHEFGHAVGLIHEHQNPEVKIDWNKPKVIADLTAGIAPWTLAQIEKNLFQAYDKAEMNSTKFDAQSIMLYPIPKTWTRNGYSVGLNTALSETDKKFIRAEYPR